MPTRYGRVMRVVDGGLSWWTFRTHDDLPRSHRTRPVSLLEYLAVDEGVIAHLAQLSRGLEGSRDAHHD